MTLEFHLRQLAKQMRRLADYLDLIHDSQVSEPLKRAAYQACLACLDHAVLSIQAERDRVSKLYEESR